MQRRYLFAGGGALVLLLVAVVLLLRPAPNGSPGTPSASATATPPAAAAATPGPSGTEEQLSAEAGDTVVTLTWTGAQGAAGYSVYRDGGSTPLNPTPVTVTRYEDIGLSNGRTYTYTVAPVDASGKPGAPLPEVQVAPRSK